MTGVCRDTIAPDRCIRDPGLTGASMVAVRILWIDLCGQTSVRGIIRLVPSTCEVARVDRFEGVPATVRQFRPQLACIEFDYPDQGRLRAVPWLTRTFPALPLLMFTEYHSEALAIWAFRSGVWDYRVKPVTDHTLVRSIEVLAARVAAGCPGPLRGKGLPADLIEPAGHLRRAPSAARKTGLAVTHIAGHFDRVIKRDALADLCHLSPSEFSRAFKREQGSTFAHFLLEYRIAMARDFLAEPHMTISQVAFSAGFNDISYFSRAFRRLGGVTASEYQRHVRSVASGAEPPGDCRHDADLSCDQAGLF